MYSISASSSQATYKKRYSERETAHYIAMQISSKIPIKDLITCVRQWIEARPDSLEKFRLSDGLRVDVRGSLDIAARNLSLPLPPIDPIARYYHIMMIKGVAASAALLNNDRNYYEFNHLQRIIFDQVALSTSLLTFNAYEIHCLKVQWTSLSLAELSALQIPPGERTVTLPEQIFFNIIEKIEKMVYMQA